jgi:hypothetical protein
MGNIAPSILSSFKVKFTREAPNDFYLSGDRVQGIIEIVTKDKDNDVNFKHGPLYVELIGKLKDCKTNSHQQRIATGVQIFFRQRAQVIKLPNDNQQMVRYSFKENISYRNNMFNIASNFFFSYQFRFVNFLMSSKLMKISSRSTFSHLDPWMKPQGVVTVKLFSEKLSRKVRLLTVPMSYRFKFSS